MATYDLARFKQAQDRESYPGRTAFAVAVDELRAGMKRSHWIWFVFPQLRGLGHSPQAVHYGIDGTSEAFAYLRDPVLRSRYLEVLAIVHNQLVDGNLPLEVLMGWDIDAMKLISSATLFEHIANKLRSTETEPGLLDELARIESLARGVLDAAEKQGYSRCEFTLRQRDDS